MIMSIRFRRSAVLATAVLAAVLPLYPATARPAVDAAAIEATVREYLEATGVPGAAVAVTHDDQVLLAEGYGRTPAGDSITAHTPMAVASLSKSFTALAVMQLVEANLVDLDRPVRVYLPEFIMSDPRVGQVTVRQLLNQTSGMSDTTFRAFSRPQPSSLREAVADMRTARLAAAPGARWEYHNPNFQVAARLVEVVSSRSFDEYLRENIFGPLGMADSRTVNTAHDLPPSAQGHLMILGLPIAVPEPYAFGNGSGGVLSSAHDLAAWLIAQLNEGRGPDGTAIISAASIAAMRTPSQVSGSYGLGWFVGTTRSGAPEVSHSGDLFTSTAQQVLFTGTGHGIAVMANTGLAYGDAKAIASRIVSLLEGEPVLDPGRPYLVVDVAMLALTAATAFLAVCGIRRSHRWANRRTKRLGTVARLLPLLVVPLLLLSTIHRIVGVLYRGRDVAWIQVAYLYPIFMVLLAAAALAGLVVFVARLAGLARTASRGEGGRLRWRTGGVKSAD